MQNPQLPGVELEYTPIGFDPGFPLHFVDGWRDDQAITRLHIHDALEIGCCLEGSGTFYIGPKIFPFHAGDVTLITDREYHRSRSSPGTRSRWAWFFLHPTRLLVPHTTPALKWEPERFSGVRFGNILTAESHPEISSLAWQLYQEARETDEHTRTNLRAIALLLINRLHRRFPKPEGEAGADHSARALARIAPALQLVAERFHEPLAVPDMAAACGMSVRNFQLQFTTLMGRGPQAHLLRSRIHAAAALLAERHQPVTEIAYACGFNTLSSFNRAFKAEYGCSPRDYRRDGPVYKTM